MPDAEKIGKALKLAALGYSDAARTFFESFFSYRFIIAQRYQPHPLTFCPQYPNDFINILAVADGDRVIVPVFLSADDLYEWSDQLPNIEEIEGRKLIERMPEQWWICLNPGQELEKEFSPWEINQLKAGPAAIDAIIEEIYPSIIGQPIEISPLQTGEFQDLLAALCAEAPKHPSLKRIYAARETYSGIEDNQQSSVVVGLEIDSNIGAELEQIKRVFENLVDRAQIGDEHVRVLAGSTARDIPNQSSAGLISSSLEGNLVLGIFKGCRPIYDCSGDTSAPAGKSLAQLLRKVLRK